MYTSYVICSTTNITSCHMFQLHCMSIYIQTFSTKKGVPPGALLQELQFRFYFSLSFARVQYQVNENRKPISSKSTMNNNISTKQIVYSKIRKKKKYNFSEVLQAIFQVIMLFMSFAFIMTYTSSNSSASLSYLFQNNNIKHNIVAAGFYLIISYDQC